MFGKGKKTNDASELLPIVTTDDYHGKDYEVIGLVTAEKFWPTPTTRAKFSEVTNAISKEAESLGADAVVGFRIIQYNNAGIYGYGTAIRFK
ncbi:hypothetical protein [Alicyclobacillus acidoterrestris]|uniref:Uncharacterized protein n=1 Tax=Alicyclobacillus acidoterrestris (strain ATCC 49025 / DSM 3922 / CIP 106132 / NCIMB 13137 / GD3B) TaxID=1356854 RepID=T0C515_ALIAG|nr:hypothetical protein [Alicyclobacillus acidoterrestris]EPZ47630.1 hypothetical protein N007_05070 [Alicyclobacillus acidoterrestris ATCC 49025]UNO48050.1 hypothetical protein K1I37_15360 [Alicyclobacillus acidoterrestris]